MLANLQFSSDLFTINPLSTNSKTHSHNSLATSDKLLEFFFTILWSCLKRLIKKSLTENITVCSSDVVCMKSILKRRCGWGFQYDMKDIANGSNFPGILISTKCSHKSVYWAISVIYFQWLWWTSCAVR